MALFGGADKIVIGAVQRRDHFFENSGVPVGQFNGGDPLFFRRLLHFLAVFIGAGEKEYPLAVEPLEARQNICADSRIGVANMRRAIGVKDGRGDIKAVVAAGRHLSCSVSLAPASFRKQLWPAKSSPVAAAGYVC